MSWTVPLFRCLASTSILAAMLFLCAARTGAPMVKAYLAVFAGMGLVTALANDPSQDGEPRTPGPAEIHPSSRLAASTLFLVTVLVAALDAGRFHWIQAMNGETQILALAALLLAAGLQVWAIAANPFFSSAIRIQTDRGHEIVTRGPYRFVRHPGYLAMAIIMPAMALALGSLVAVVPALCYSVLILWRTGKEDDFLIGKLPGYAGYTGRVPYRLVPGIW